MAKPNDLVQGTLDLLILKTISLASVVTQNRPMRVTSKPANEKARDIDSDGSPYRLLRYEQCLERSRSEEHTSELQSQSNLVCRLLLEKKNTAMHGGLPPPGGERHPAEATIGGQ